MRNALTCVIGMSVGTIWDCFLRGKHTMINEQGKTWVEWKRSVCFIDPYFVPLTALSTEAAPGNTTDDLTKAKLNPYGEKTKQANKHENYRL